ncbi:MAG: restriction endonuclease [Planctomycetaceae bacterium]
MGRSRRKKSSGLDDLFDFLVMMPTWVGPIVAFLAFAALRWFIPWAFTPSDPDDVVGIGIASTIGNVTVQVAPWAGGGVLVIWCFALLQKWSNRERLDRQTGIDSIRELSWSDFERLLAEAFRRQGYLVEHAGDAGPDGGVDLRLRKAGETTLVQCKHWRSVKVGVKIVRELYGVVASERATAGIIVATGEFTPDASDFAERNGVRLIGGEELARMIRGVQKAPPIVSPSESAAPPKCPKCGCPMTRRTARKGANAGSQFWGCPRYPDCRSTRPLSEANA